MARPLEESHRKTHEEELGALIANWKIIFTADTMSDTLFRGHTLKKEEADS
jgi:hypothetical protein